MIEWPSPGLGRGQNRWNARDVSACRVPARRTAGHVAQAKRDEEYTSGQDCAIADSQRG